MVRMVGSHYDALIVGFFLRLDRIFWISIPHLPDEVFEDVRYVPVLFGRGFEEWEIPSLR
jgi:hypothetical protein